MATTRQEFRQHSKSTLLRAAGTVFRERELVIAAERRRWIWRCWAAGVVGFALGVLTVMLR